MQSRSRWSSECLGRHVRHDNTEGDWNEKVSVTRQHFHPSLWPLPSAFPACHAPREMRLTCKCNEWKFSWSDIVQHRKHYWAIALQFVVDFQGGSWSRTLPHSYSSQLHSCHNLSSLSALQSVSSLHPGIVTIISLLHHFAKCQESSRVFHNRTRFTTIPKQKTKALCWEIFL